MKHQADVGALSSRIMFQSVSNPLRLAFASSALLHPHPISVPYGFAFRAICKSQLARDDLPFALCRLLREEYGVSVFRAFDEIDGLGLLSPPAGRRPCRES